MTDVALDAVFAMIGIIGLFLIAAVFVLYLLASIGLYGMGKKAGVKHSWLAFIPVFQYYVVGKIIREVKIGKMVISNAEIVLPLALVIGPILQNVRIVGPIVNIVIIVLFIATTYQLIKLYRSEKATLYTVLSMIVPGFLPILMFVLKNESPSYQDDNNSDDTYYYRCYYN